MRNHPFGGVSTTTLALGRHNSAKPTPFAHCEFGFVERRGNFGGGIVVLDSALGDNCIQRCFDALQSLDEIFFVHEIPPLFSKTQV